MTNRPPGKIIYLSGISSAGKTTLARELQQVLPAPFLYLGIDLFIYMLPPGYWDADPAGFTLEKSERGTEIKTGPLAQDLGRAMLDTIENLARTGRNLIVDDVMLSQDYLESCLAKLAGLPLLLVKVYCPLEIAEQRERERGDRDLGMVKFQYGLVEATGGYDLTVDTAANTTAECARQIVARLEQSQLQGWPQGKPAR
jgi:chloramphenicol 3-O phosphotransferase